MLVVVLFAPTDTATKRQEKIDHRGVRDDVPHDNDNMKYE